MPVFFLQQGWLTRSLQSQNTVSYSLGIQLSRESWLIHRTCLPFSGSCEMQLILDLSVYCSAICHIQNQNWCCCGCCCGGRNIRCCKTVIELTDAVKKAFSVLQSRRSHLPLWMQLSQIARIIKTQIVEHRSYQQPAVEKSILRIDRRFYLIGFSGVPQDSTVFDANFRCFCNGGEIHWIWWWRGRWGLLGFYRRWYPRVHCYPKAWTGLDSMFIRLDLS
jgi:hypothetical protein